MNVRRVVARGFLVRFREELSEGRWRCTNRDYSGSGKWYNVFVYDVYGNQRVRLAVRPEGLEVELNCGRGRVSSREVFDYSDPALVDRVVGLVVGWCS